MHTSSLQIACGSLKLANITRLRTLCWDLQRSQRQLGTQFRLDFHWDFLHRIWGFGNLSFIIYQALQLGLTGAASCLLWCFLIEALSTLGCHQSPFVQDVMSLYRISSMYVVHVNIHTAVYMCTYNLSVQCDWSSSCKQSWSMGEEQFLFSADSGLGMGPWSASACAWVGKQAQIFCLSPVSNQGAALCRIRSLVLVLQNCALIL